MGWRWRLDWVWSLQQSVNQLSLCDHEHSRIYDRWAAVVHWAMRCAEWQLSLSRRPKRGFSVCFCVRVFRSDQFLAAAFNFMCIEQTPNAVFGGVNNAGLHLLLLL